MGLVSRLERVLGTAATHSLQSHSQYLVMAYVTDTPSRRLDSYIILTLADVGRRIDSFLFHTSAEGRPWQRTPPPKYMSNVKGVGQAANVHMSAT